MNNDPILNLLYTVLAIAITIVAILVVVLIVIGIKKKQPEKEAQKETIDSVKSGKKKTELGKTVEGPVVYNKQSIYSFMDFDKVEDNMIVRKNGHRYIMVIECQGINYDLMSGVEKTGVEQGFIQFLNTLRYPIQIYTQTRTVNLGNSIEIYRAKLKEVENRLVSKQLEYNSKLNSGQYTPVEMERQRIDVLREKNLYEYGRDIIENTEKMSLNKSILRKHYYIVFEYMPEETETVNYGKDEIANMAFAELYTKAQSAIGSLAVCGIHSKILNSNELVELLYMAYNRDEAEVYGLDKALRAGYEDLYSTAPDVFEKRLKALDRKIEEDGIRKANEVLFEAAEDKEREREIKEKEKNLDNLIREMAKYIIEENENTVGRELATAAKEKLDKEGEKKADEEKPTIRKRRTIAKTK